MNEQKFNKQNLVIITNRNELKITGVEKVTGFSETAITLNISNQTMTVLGEQMHAQKLDVENGELVVMGLINSIKWDTKKEKIPLLKRIFKWFYTKHFPNPYFC